MDDEEKTRYFLGKSEYSSLLRTDSFETLWTRSWMKRTRRPPRAQGNNTDGEPFPPRFVSYHIFQRKIHSACVN